MADQSEQAFSQALKILVSQNLLSQIQKQQKKDSPQWIQWMHPDILNSKQAALWSLSESRPFIYNEKHKHLWYKNVFLPTIRASAGYYHVPLSAGLQCFGIGSAENQQEGFKKFSLTGKDIVKRMQNGIQPTVFHRIRCSETSYNHNQTPLGFSHPFPPEVLSVQYASNSLKINSNTIQSFLEYYGSCSIRHKDDTSLLLELQQEIYNQLRKESQLKSEMANSGKHIKNNLFPLLAICIHQNCSSLQDRKNSKKIYQKVYRFLKPLIGSIVQTYQEENEIPSYMKELKYKDSFKEDYKQVYDQLLQLKADNLVLAFSNDNQPQNSQQSPKNNECESILSQSLEEDSNDLEESEEILQSQPKKKLKVERSVSKPSIATNTQQTFVSLNDKDMEDDGIKTVSSKMHKQLILPGNDTLQSTIATSTLIQQAVSPIKMISPLPTQLQESLIPQIQVLPQNSFVQLIQPNQPVYTNQFFIQPQQIQIQHTQPQFPINISQQQQQYQPGVNQFTPMIIQINPQQPPQYFFNNIQYPNYMYSLPQNQQIFQPVYQTQNIIQGNYNQMM